jgi:phospholipase A1
MRLLSSRHAILFLFLPLVLLVPNTLRAETPPFDFPFIQAESGLTPHKEMFLLPFTYANEYHGSQTEVIFQLSGKYRILGSRFYIAYTQISFWQAYDIGNSSPFRETNYNPELFYRFKEKTWGPGLAGADVGFEHESNGQAMPLSRSWNLLYAAPYYHGKQWLAYVKLRYRIPEDPKEAPDSGEGDDNPDITDYLGWSDIHFYYHFSNRHMVHLLVRGYIGTDKGIARLNWSFPIPSFKNTYFLVRGSSGYGESLADYNKSINRIGVGFMFNH